MVKSVEFPNALDGSPEGPPKTDAAAHSSLKKVEAKASPINLLDFIKLLSLKRLVQENQLPADVLSSPQKRVDALGEKLRSKDDRVRDSARKEIEKILVTAGLLEDAEDRLSAFVDNPNSTKKESLGIVELTRKSTFARRGVESKTEKTAAQIESNIFKHFKDPDVQKVLRGERVPDDIKSRVEKETLDYYVVLESFVSEKLNVPENHPGLAAARASFEELATRVKIQRERSMPKGSYTSAVFHQRELFVDNKPDRLLQIRKSRRGKKQADEERLEAFRKQVAEDFDPADPKVNNKTIDQLIEGIQTTASWRSGAAVFADKRGSFELIDGDIDTALLMVEEGYLDLLAEKMIDKLNLSENDPFRGKVVDWLRVAINSRRGLGRSVGKGSFEKGILKWDDLKNDVNNMRILAEQKALYETQRGGRGRGVPSSELSALEVGAMGMPPEMSAINQHDRVATLEAMETFINSRGLDKFSVEDLISKDVQMQERVDRAMREALSQSGMSKPEQEREFARGRAHLDRLRMSIDAQKGGENLTFARLEKELEAGNVQKYLWDLKAYFERVGPRESSSDWELAMIIRRAKEVLSQPHVFGGELGNNWGIWEGQLFGRGNFTEISSKEFGQRAPALLKQDVLFQSMSPEQQWMNGVMVHVKTFIPAPTPEDPNAGTWEDRGEKKVLSTLSYYQMLKRDAYADMTLSSEVNATDSMQQQVMLCLLYGDGTYTQDGPVIKVGGADVVTKNIFDKSGHLIGNTNDRVVFDFFDEKGKTTTTVEDRKIGALLGESLVLSRWAEATWYYSLEWRKNNLDFNLDRYRRINKNILKLLSLEAYDGHYGPGEPGMRDVLKGGSLLPDYFTYKLGDVEKSAVGQWLIKEGVALPQAEWVAEFMADNLVQKVDIKGAKFNMGTLSVEDVRLKSRQVNSLQEAWEIYTARERSLKNGRDLSDIPDMNAVLAKSPSQRSDKEKFFLEQSQLFYEGIKERAITQKKWQVLNGQADIITKDGKNLGRLSPEAAKTIAKRLIMQRDPTGRTRVPENVTWQWIFENFEYGAVMDYDGQKKQSDVMDFMGYFEDSEAAYGALQQYAMCTAEWKVLETIALTINKYQPAHEVEKWVLEALSQENKLRTNPTKTYEIPDSDETYLTKYKKWKDPKTGKVWYLNDKDGMRVTYKRKVKHDLLGRSHLKKTRDLENYTRADIEVRAKKLFGMRILSEKGRERVLAEGIGKKWKRIALRMLWFDEPLFALYELYEELKKYGSEVGKEMISVVKK